jgi:hypothetical protein
MTTSVTKTVLATTGGVASAVASALCCAGPLVAVALGLSGAGLAATFEPLRPYFVADTVLAPRLRLCRAAPRGEEGVRARHPVCLADRPPSDAEGALARDRRSSPAGHLPVVVEICFRIGG